MKYNRIIKCIILCLIQLLLLNLCACRNHEINFRIFANIEECQKINSFKSEYADVEIYDSPARDKHLNNLEFLEWFGCKYTSEDCTFEIFAYEFLDSGIAMAYFKNVTGKEHNPNPTFSQSTGLRFYESIVVSGNRAYSIYGNKYDKANIIEFLNNWFSETIN